MARVLIETYGCTLNQADSEMMKSILERTGHMVEQGRYEDGKQYDYVIVNTCTVKKATEQKILHRLGKMASLRGRLVVSGCMASANPDRVAKAAPLASVISTSNTVNIARAVEMIAQRGRVEYTEYSRVDKLAYPLDCTAPIAKIPVSEGCLSNCNFCETKFARGPLNSFSQELILKAIENSVRSGAKEIQLTSQDIGAYGADRGTNIAELVHAAAGIDGEFMIRIGMLNPEHLHKYFDQLVEAYRSRKVYKFIHIPVQSGSNKVLAEMARRYTVDDYIGFVEELKRKVDDITIATDFIVGYPTETDDDFSRSMLLLEQTRPSRANISRFGARPHTKAAALKGLDGRTLKSRTVEMYRLGRKIEQEELRKAIGRREQILVTEINKGSPLGRDSAYREVTVKGSGAKLGDIIDVEITGAYPACLIGTPA